MSKKNNSRSQRGYHYPTTNYVAAPVYRFSSVLPDLVRSLEDRRTFHPLQDYRPARALSMHSAEVVISRRTHPHAQRNATLPRDHFSFRVPAKVAICAKRQIRKEVLFAKRLTRKGAGGSRRRNYYSDVGC